PPHCGGVEKGGRGWHRSRNLYWGSFQRRHPLPAPPRGPAPGSDLPESCLAEGPAVAVLPPLLEVDQVAVDLIVTRERGCEQESVHEGGQCEQASLEHRRGEIDRKSTRLNSS